MEVALTWDLLLIIFFIVILSYSYIVGQNGTIKIILSAYIAMLCANGIGNLLARYILLSEPLVNVLETSPEENVILFKIFTFVMVTLILVLRGGFIIEMGRENSFLARMVTTTIFGFLSAGLIMSTILVFIGGTTVDGFLVSSLSDSLEIPVQTAFARSLIDYYNFWFAAPAIAFVGLSIVNSAAPPPPVAADEELV